MRVKNKYFWSGLLILFFMGSVMLFSSQAELQERSTRCKANEQWNKKTKKCECKPGFVRSQLDNRCKTLAEIADELKNEGENSVNKDKVEKRSL